MEKQQILQIITINNPMVFVGKPFHFFQGKTRQIEQTMLHKGHRHTNFHPCANPTSETNNKLVLALLTEKIQTNLLLTKTEVNSRQTTALALEHENNF